MSSQIRLFFRASARLRPSRPSPRWLLEPTVTEVETYSGATTAKVPTIVTVKKIFFKNFPGPRATLGRCSEYSRTIFRGKFFFSRHLTGPRVGARARPSRHQHHGGYRLRPQVTVVVVFSRAQPRCNSPSTTSTTVASVTALAAVTAGQRLVRVCARVDQHHGGFRH